MSKLTLCKSSKTQLCTTRPGTGGMKGKTAQNLLGGIMLR